MHAAAAASYEVRLTVPSINAPGPEALSSRTTVRVVELHGPGSVRAAERAVPSDGALLQVETTGVCGTDHHIYAGRLAVPTPQLLGHEVIGRLMRLPEDHGLVCAAGAAPPALGDRVLVAPGVPCGDCEGCARVGRCLDRPCYGLTMVGDGLTGGFAPLMELRAGTRVYLMPEATPRERAVFAEPLACVLSALRKAFGGGYVPAGMDGLVLGFGAIGIVAAVAIHAAGGRVTVVERDARRRALAAELGFATVPDTSEVTHPAPLVVDAAGTPTAFAAGLGLLAWSGTLIEIGNFADLGPIPIKPSDICLRDLRIVGSGETFYEDFAPAIAMVSETPVDLARAITDVHEFAALADPSDLFTAPAAGKALVAFA
ncbi:MAG TPA: alcohol dehydrogenase catalytic domain-containing protein [Conexibacter sp.]|nr:alcohol dehydrogenase catalytic domain-containing protein [Conexibacter sp.]